MNVEVMIYFYLAVCAAMIVFNVVCIFLFKHNDREIESHSKIFAETIRKQILGEGNEEESRAYLRRQFERVRNLRALDVTLGELEEENREDVIAYIHSMLPVFQELTIYYSRKNEIQAAYFPYLIEKYHLFEKDCDRSVIRTLQELVRSDSLYARENALHALYSIGNEEAVVDSLRILDNTASYHHKKLLTDGLLCFSGDKEAFNELLWKRFDSFSVPMQNAILDYFRFGSGAYRERMYEFLNTECDQELCFSAIRYFGKYPYEPAYEKLIEFAQNESDAHWEYASIAAFSLASYPGERTGEVLKGMLCSRNWYVRFNASQSLDRLGYEYADLLDIFESDDRYASEMLRYWLDRKKLTAKGGG